MQPNEGTPDKYDPTAGLSIAMVILVVEGIVIAGLWMLTT